MGIFLIIIFASWLHWINVIPTSWDEPKFWILPALVLGFNTTAFTARLTRSAMLEILRQDYVRTARAKGLAERVVVLRHMLKNALIPVVTILGPALAALVTGSFIIETIFGFPGMGRAFVQSIGQRDYSMIMGTTLIYALLVAVANLSVDIVYVFIDPRIRLEN
jgi:ABC-type dipeptide/oligopeptide/nickel transport system permease component